MSQPSCSLERKRASGRKYAATHRAERAAYYASHREEIVERSRAWRATHRDKHRAYARAYYHEHRDERLAYAKAHNEIGNPARTAWLAAHREEQKEAYRAWSRANPEKVAAKGAIRRARIKAAAVGDPAAIRRIYRQARENKRVRCYLCGKLIPLGERHVDHIMPLSKGGAHTTANLAIACAGCNRRKEAKMPHEVGVLL